jgi:arylsulfatase A-like enzyme
VFTLKSKPNIILFITHDQGQFLGCYDSIQTPNSLSTPNLNHIANTGVKFTNHFCTAPQCSPSRGSIITSKYPHQNGLMGLVNRGWTLPVNNKTLPMYLKENGYTTHLIGLEHETKDTTTLGYDTVSKRMKYQRFTTDKLERDFLEFFESHKHDDKPFFVNMGTFEVHRPFEIWNIQVESHRVKVPPFLPDNDIVRKDLGLYYGVINRVDLTIEKS